MNDLTKNSEKAIFLRKLLQDSQLHTRSDIRKISGKYIIPKTSNVFFSFVAKKPYHHEEAGGENLLSKV